MGNVFLETTSTTIEEELIYVNVAYCRVRVVCDALTGGAMMRNFGYELYTG